MDSSNNITSAAAEAVTEALREPSPFTAIGLRNRVFPCTVEKLSVPKQVDKDSGFITQSCKMNLALRVTPADVEFSRLKDGLYVLEEVPGYDELQLRANRFDKCELKEPIQEYWIELAELVVLESLTEDELAELDSINDDLLEPGVQIFTLGLPDILSPYYQEPEWVRLEGPVQLVRVVPDSSKASETPRGEVIIEVSNLPFSQAGELMYPNRYCIRFVPLTKQETEKRAEEAAPKPVKTPIDNFLEETGGTVQPPPASTNGATHLVDEFDVGELEVVQAGEPRPDLLADTEDIIEPEEYDTPADLAMAVDEQPARKLARGDVKVKDLTAAMVEQIPAGVQVDVGDYNFRRQWIHPKGKEQQGPSTLSLWNGDMTWQARERAKKDKTPVVLEPELTSAELVEQFAESNFNFRLPYNCDLDIPQWMRPLIMPSQLKEIDERAAARRKLEAVEALPAAVKGCYYGHLTPAHMDSLLNDTKPPANTWETPKKTPREWTLYAGDTIWRSAAKTVKGEKLRLWIQSMVDKPKALTSEEFIAQHRTDIVRIERQEKPLTWTKAVLVKAGAKIKDAKLPLPEDTPEAPAAEGQEAEA
jgi:hypothetical protein